MVAIVSVLVLGIVVVLFMVCTSDSKQTSNGARVQPSEAMKNCHDSEFYKIFCQYLQEAIGPYEEKIRNRIEHDRKNWYRSHDERFQPRDASFYTERIFSFNDRQASSSRWASSSDTCFTYRNSGYAKLTNQQLQILKQTVLMDFPILWADYYKDGDYFELFFMPEHIDQIIEQEIIYLDRVDPHNFTPSKNAF